MGDSKIHGLSILHRLLIAFFLTFILVCSALTTTYYFFSRNSLSQHANEAVFRELDAINDTFQNTIRKTLTHELKLLSANPSLDEFLMSSDDTKDINARAVERLFLQSIKYFDGIERVRFVDSRGRDQVIVDQKGRVREYSFIGESKLFVDLEMSPPGSIAHTELSAKHNDGYLFSIGIHKTDPDIGEFGGAVIIDYNCEDFFTLVKLIRVFGENPVWIFSPAGKVLLKPSDQETLDPRPFSQSVSNAGVNVYPHHNGLVAASDLEIVENAPLLKVCISIPESLLYQDIQQVLLFLTIVFAVSFFLIVFVVFFISRYLSLPLIKLAKSVQKLSLENSSEQIDIHATGEVGMLVDSFNSMSHNLKKTTVSKNYVNNIFHAMTNSLIVLDSEGLIETVNMATLSLLGYQENELIGQPCSLIIEDTLFAKIKKNAHVTKLETLYRAQNGSEFPMLFSSSVMYTNQGEFQAVVCLALDLTEQKQIEQEKNLLEAQLWQTYKMEAIGTLAGGIAHDFNNILSAIIGYAELAMVELRTTKVQPAIADIEEVIKGGMRAKDLVRQILTFSRKDQHTVEPLIPSLIVKEALKLLRSTIPKSIDIKASIDSGVGTILADPMKIHQVTMNLCTNAAQAMETGKGIITVTLTQKELHKQELLGEQGVNPGQYVELSVCDTGRGIDPADKDRIFDPFFTTKEVGSGTGMGLAVIHGIVKEYNGLIRVKSDPGTGSCFQVYFPVIERDMPVVEGKNTNLVGGSERILIVDDEQDVLEIMKRRIKRLGYVVTVYHKATEAVAAFKDNPNNFDLIITDQTMPQMLGTEMAAEILKIRPNIPIILCSGFSSTVSKATSKDFGFKAYLSKPVDFKTLSLSIRHALS